MFILIIDDQINYFLEWEIFYASFPAPHRPAG